jgi:RNA polymerase sigma-70 factor, ECF subfamily
MPTLHCNVGTTDGLEPAGPRRLSGDKAAVTGTILLSQIKACIPALRRYAASMLCSQEAADDLVHDCMVRALDTLPARREETDVRAWLFKHLHNLFINRTRRHRFRALPDVRDATACESARIGCPSENAGPPWRDLLRGLERLTEEQRSAVLLVSVEDMSYPEAAAVLGVPAHAMMSYLAQGRERLRQFTSPDPGPAPRRFRWAVTPAA